MPQHCKLCESPQRSEIEQKLAEGMTSREAAKLLGCDHSSVNRHVRNHLRVGISAARKINDMEALTELEERHLGSGINVVKQVEKAHDRCMMLFKEALSRGNIRDALRALEVEIKQLQLSAKIQGVYADSTPQINLLMQPEFIQLKKVVIEGLKEYPDKLPEISARFDAMVADKSETTIKREINEIIEVELSDNATQE